MPKSRRPRQASAVTFDEIARDHERNARGGYVPVYDLVHLRRFFGRRHATAIQPPLVIDYCSRRHGEGASRAEINDELWTLSWICHAAVKNGKLLEMPTIQFLPRDLPPPVRVEMLQPARTVSSRVGRMTDSRSALATMTTTRRGRPGRKPALTDQVFQKHLRDHDGSLSDEQRARILSTELGRAVSHDEVARARRRSGIPPATRNAE